MRMGCSNVDRWMDGWDTAIDVSTWKNEAEAAIRRRAIPFVYDVESSEIHALGPCPFEDVLICRYWIRSLANPSPPSQQSQPLLHQVRQLHYPMANLQVSVIGLSNHFH